MGKEKHKTGLLTSVRKKKKVCQLMMKRKRTHLKTENSDTFILLVNTFMFFPLLEKEAKSCRKMSPSQCKR